MSETYTSAEQQAEIVKYISDTMKLPLIGAGGGFAPLGMYGFSCDYVLTPPQGWLFADGSIYNIADYPEYAALLASQHGRANIYGGDGVTTFATKDLRGEFIRGWGQNSHENQGDGANVGEHQDGTEHCGLDVGGSNHMTRYVVKTSGLTDSMTDLSTKTRISSASDSGSYGYTYTSRPTNTSVAFFVKATLSDAEINAFHVYTPREHQVAWWEEEIDGVWKRKPVYEKVVDFGACPNNTTKTVAHNISNVEEWVKVRCTFNDTLGRGFEVIISNGNIANNILANVAPTVCSIESKMNIATFTAKFTLRYTKTTDQWQTS